MLWECEEIREDSEALGRMIRRRWGGERWEKWARGSEEEKTAEVIGLKGECTQEQMNTVAAFFVHMEKNKKERESGARTNAERRGGGTG